MSEPTYKRNEKALEIEIARKEALRKADAKFEREKSLYNIYQIPPEAPLRMKVSQLKDSFGFDTSEIADLLDIPVEDVQKVVSKLDAEIAHAGRELTEEEKKHQRGRYILAMDKMLSALLQEFEQSKDEKVAGHISRITEKLIEMRNLARSTDDMGASLGFSTKLEETIAEMSPERLTELRNALNDA